MHYKFLRFPGGKEKAITLSYDDGTYDDRRLIETVNKYGLKVTLNIVSSFMGKFDRFLTAPELLELAESGNHEIAVHGATHLALAKGSLKDGICDILDGRRELEKTFGRIIQGMAFADTGVNEMTGDVSKDDIKSYLKALDIAYSRTLGGDNDRFAMPEDFYEWMPTAHHNNPNLFKYLDEFLSAEMPEYCALRTPKLFYLWGHSFEYKKNNNWNVLEDFCKKAGGRSDIWYATNIEIYDYVAAYRALQFNVENTLVFNPTCTKVWFEADNVMFCVEPGETKKIIIPTEAK